MNEFDKEEHIEDIWYSRLGKFYKPGQLVTIDRHVYRITKTNELLTCEHCVNYKHLPSKCRYFGCWGHVPINCYFKLVK